MIYSILHARCISIFHLIAMPLMHQLSLLNPYMDSPFQESSSTTRNSLQFGFQMGFKKIKLNCQYCSEYLCEATECYCGHVFCRECIAFYLLFLDACPVCEVSLRKTTLFKNIPLDNIIEDCIQGKDPQSLSKFRERRRAFTELRKGRRIRRVRERIHVDIRDNDYVWCVGVIVKVINRNKRNALLIVQLKYSKERIMARLEDDRVAMVGSYTNRKEIPHYSQGRLLFQHEGIETQLINDYGQNNKQKMT